MGRRLEIFASAARTANTTSAEFEQLGDKEIGLLLTLDVTSITATPSITLAVQWQDEVSSNWRDLFITSAAVTAVGTTSYLIWPGSGTTAHGGLIEVVPHPVPDRWRVVVVHADTDSITYSVGVWSGP